MDSGKNMCTCFDSKNKSDKTYERWNSSDRLRDQWGVVDVNDPQECVKYIVSEGLVDGKRVVIRGGSAGECNHTESRDRFEYLPIYDRWIHCFRFAHADS